MGYRTGLPFKRKAKVFIACPKCDQPTRVYNSRGTDANEVWRRRECLKGHRFTTVERWGEDHGKVFPGQHRGKGGTFVRRRKAKAS